MSLPPATNVSLSALPICIPIFIMLPPAAAIDLGHLARIGTWYDRAADRERGPGQRIYCDRCRCFVPEDAGLVSDGTHDLCEPCFKALRRPSLTPPAAPAPPSTTLVTTMMQSMLQPDRSRSPPPGAMTAMMQPMMQPSRAPLHPGDPRHRYGPPPPGAVTLMMQPMLQPDRPRSPPTMLTRMRQRAFGRRSPEPMSYMQQRAFGSASGAPLSTYEARASDAGAAIIAPVTKMMQDMLTSKRAAKRQARDRRQLAAKPQ